MEQEFENYQDYSKKLDSTVILNNLKQKIIKKKLLIKKLKNNIHLTDMKNKKNSKILLTHKERKNKQVSFKKIIYEVDSYLNKNENLKE